MATKAANKPGEIIAPNLGSLSEIDKILYERKGNVWIVRFVMRASAELAHSEQHDLLAKTIIIKTVNKSYVKRTFVNQCPVS